MILILRKMTMNQVVFSFNVHIQLVLVFHVVIIPVPLKPFLLSVLKICLK